MFVMLLLSVLLCAHREGISWAEIEWVDNGECIDLIEKVWVVQCHDVLWSF